MPAISTGSKVLLTGGTGFLGAWILKTLLEDGFSVRAAVRSQSKADYLKSRLVEYQDKLEFVLVEDITTPGIFDDAVKDVDAVIHTASPLSGPDPMIEPDKLLNPAVDGTLGVLKSALNSPTVKRIVVTASVSACIDLRPKHTPITYDEAHWNNQAVEVITQQGKDAPIFAKYSASKLLAERAAWEWVKETSPHFDLVTILPSFVFGKIISETTADIKGSNTRLLGSLKTSALTNPSPDTLRAEWPIVDVRDVSRHHILCLTVAEAGGERIISSNRTATVQEAINILNANPVEGITLPPPQTLSDWQAKVSLSHEKSIKILGAHYRPVEETIRDTVVGALEVGWKQARRYMKNMASELPFDVLCIIFEQYAKFDDQFTPLETLLLVCKSWHNAALRDRRLWANFEMDLSYLEDLFYWNACLKRRLDRCPTSILLDVRITFLRFLGPQSDKPSQDLFTQMAGKFGEFARRWRRFVLLDIPGYLVLPNQALQRCFSFPTPNLEEFRWVNYRMLPPWNLLPYTHSLKILHASGRHTPTLPNLANTTDLGIAHLSFRKCFGERNEQAIALAINVVTMKIYSFTPLKLTATYRRLQTLEFGGILHKDCLSTFCAPILTNLALGFNVGESFHPVLSCKGINLGTLRKVRLYREPVNFVDDDGVAEYLDGVRQFLTAASDLEILVLEHAPIAHAIIKLFIHECRLLYQSRTLQIMLKEHAMEWETELGQGESRTSSIEQFKKEVGCIDACTQQGDDGPLQPGWYF